MIISRRAFVWSLAGECSGSWAAWHYLDGKKQLDGCKMIRHHKLGKLLMPNYYHTTDCGHLCVVGIHWANQLLCKSFHFMQIDTVIPVPPDWMHLHNNADVEAYQEWCLTINDVNLRPHLQNFIITRFIGLAACCILKARKILITHPAWLAVLASFIPLIAIIRANLRAI